MLTHATAAPLPRSQLTSLLCHELLSPLSAALWSVAMAERRCAPPVPPEARSALEAARGQIEELHRLVARLIELETQGHPSLQPVEADLLELVDASVDRLTLGKPEAHAISIHGAGKVKGRWDRGVVDQIVRNLVANAMKFGRGKPITVEVSPARAGAWIAVQDRGAGIPAREQQRIFQRHVCAPKAAGGGLGLGLWLVKELARAHGGDVSVRSRPGAGATFQVYIRSGGAAERTPRGRLQQPAVRSRSAPPARSSA